MTLSLTMRCGCHGGRPIRPSLWCRRDESYIFSDFLRRNAGTNSTAGTSFDFLAGFTAFITPYDLSYTNVYVTDFFIFLAGALTYTYVYVSP